VIISTT